MGRAEAQEMVMGLGVQLGVGGCQTPLLLFRNKSYVHGDLTSWFCLSGSLSYRPVRHPDLVVPGSPVAQPEFSEDGPDNFTGHKVGLISCRGNQSPLGIGSVDCATGPTDWLESYNNSNYSRMVCCLHSPLHQLLG